MKLNKLKRVEREIKSIIYINDKNLACVSYSDFENIKDRYEDTVTIYKPNAEQTTKFIEILQEMSDTKSNKFTSEQTEYLLKELTDVEFEDVSEEEIQETIDNPTEILTYIADELDDIAVKIVARTYSTVEKIDMLPTAMKETLYMSAENQKLELENAVAERDLILELEAKKKELEEMEEKLKAKTKKKVTKTPKKK